MGWTNEGEQFLLERLLQGASNTADLFVGLYTNTTEPAETSTLASGLTEVSGGSYARVTIERSSTGWISIGLSGGDYQATSKNLTFATPTANWGTVYGLFLATVSTGTAGLLLATYHLSSSQTINNGDPAPIFRIIQKAQ